MKILLYEWPSYLQYDIERILKEQGVTVDTFAWTFKDKNHDDQFEACFAKNVEITQYDALFSVNYWPLLSKMAQCAGVIYLAWCYDNPLNVIFPEETMGNPVNRVFFFDKIQAGQYQEKGIDTVYHLPLGVNTKRLVDLEIAEAEHRKYEADISFVGSLYESRMQDIRAIVDDKTRGYLDAVMAAQQNLYGYYLVDEMVTEKLVKEINQYIKQQNPETSFCLLREALTFAMASEITRKDRLILLTLFGRRYNTKIYSFQTSEILQGPKVLPPVDYVTEMPKAFAVSKINLNPVLRCIQSGIPLRALDVMGAGGFLLSSYQPELAEQFVDGEEMVMYESIEDAVAKADFYLKHDDIRMKIAENGRKKVAKDYTLQERLQEILSYADLI